MDLDKAVNFDKLSDEQRAIIIGRNTERPFSGKLLHNKDSGSYSCAACSAKLFESDTKFDSGTGWPSFDRAIPGSVNQQADKSFGVRRTEVVCANCGAHLGHLFEDGPKDTTGKRFCINSLCLDFKPNKG